MDPARPPPQSYKVAGYDVEFPCKPYGVQMGFMGKVLNTLDSSGNALLESPTGTGKTLSLLCSALAWQRRWKKREAQPQESSGGPTPKVEGGEGGEPAAKKPKKTKVPKIFYATRTHSQIAQVVKELKRTSYRPKMALLASRDKLCVNGTVQRAAQRGGGITEECNKLLQESRCSYQHGANKLLGVQQGTLQVHDIEDLLEVAKRHKACPYFGSRLMAQDAELVFCPYSYLLDPVVRRALSINVEGAVLIFDEAHNIEDTAREAASCDVTLESLDGAYVALARVLALGADYDTYQPLAEMVQRVSYWLRVRADGAGLRENGPDSWERVYSGGDAVEELTEAGVGPDRVEHLWELYLEVRKTEEEAASGAVALGRGGGGGGGGGGAGGSQSALAGGAVLGVLSRLLQVLMLMYGGGAPRMADYRLVVQKFVPRRRAGGGGGGRGGRGGGGDDSGGSSWVVQVGLWCLNPAVAFGLISDPARSVVVSSGTLAPTGSFASELGVEFSYTLEAPHVVDVASHVWASVVATSPGGVPLNSSYKTASSTAYQDAVGEAVLSACRDVPHGLLVFLPSYHLLEKLQRRWRDTGAWKEIEKIKKLFVEPRGATDDFESIIGGYYAAADRGGALLMAVCRGKVSEGIDFRDHYARAVLCVGIPFPALKDTKVALKKAYNNEGRARGLLGGDEWYSQQAFRALNQAVGRCLRHKGDFGAVLLLDERFRHERSTRMLSRWVRGALPPPGRPQPPPPPAEDLPTFFARLAPTAPVPRPAGKGARAGGSKAGSKAAGRGKGGAWAPGGGEGAAPVKPEGGDLRKMWGHHQKGQGPRSGAPVAQAAAPGSGGEGWARHQEGQEPRSVAPPSAATCSGGGGGRRNGGGGSWGTGGGAPPREPLRPVQPAAAAPQGGAPGGGPAWASIGRGGGGGFVPPQGVGGGGFIPESGGRGGGFFGGGGFVPESEGGHGEGGGFIPECGNGRAGGGGGFIPESRDGGGGGGGGGFIPENTGRRVGDGGFIPESRDGGGGGGGGGFIPENTGRRVGDGGFIPESRDGGGGGGGGGFIPENTGRRVGDGGFIPESRDGGGGGGGFIPENVRGRGGGGGSWETPPGYQPPQPGRGSGAGGWAGGGGPHPGQGWGPRHQSPPQARPHHPIGGGRGASTGGGGGWGPGGRGDAPPSSAAAGPGQEEVSRGGCFGGGRGGAPPPGSHGAGGPAGRFGGRGGGSNPPDQCRGGRPGHGVGGGSWVPQGRGGGGGGGPDERWGAGPFHPLSPPPQHQEGHKGHDPNAPRDGGGGGGAARGAGGGAHGAGWQQGRGPGAMQPQQQQLPPPPGPGTGWCPPSSEWRWAGQQQQQQQGQPRRQGQHQQGQHQQGQHQAARPVSNSAAGQLQRGYPPSALPPSHVHAPHPDDVVPSQAASSWERNPPHTRGPPGGARVGGGAAAAGGGISPAASYYACHGPPVAGGGGIGGGLGGGGAPGAARWGHQQQPPPQPQGPPRSPSSPSHGAASSGSQGGMAGRGAVGAVAGGDLTQDGSDGGGVSQPTPRPRAPRPAPPPPAPAATPATNRKRKAGAGRVMPPPAGYGACGGAGLPRDRSGARGAAHRRCVPVAVEYESDLSDFEE